MERTQIQGRTPSASNMTALRSLSLGQRNEHTNSEASHSPMQLQTLKARATLGVRKSSLWCIPSALKCFIPFRHVTSHLFFSFPVFVGFGALSLTKCSRKRSFDLIQAEGWARVMGQGSLRADQENLRVSLLFEIIQTESTHRMLWRDEAWLAQKRIRQDFNSEGLS